MSCQEEDYPFPLSTINSPTQLYDEGLLVQYSGFLLHFQNINIVLGDNLRGGGSFTFPVDRELHEWYTAEAVDRELHTVERVREMWKDENSKSLQLAIIISRPRPKEAFPEIALLVVIYDIWRRREIDRKMKEIYCCQIIHRLKIRRRRGNDDFKIPSNREDDNCIGEILETEQQWHIDGFEIDRSMKAKMKGEADADAPLPSSVESAVSSVKRVTPAPTKQNTTRTRSWLNLFGRVSSLPRAQTSIGDENLLRVQSNIPPQFTRNDRNRTWSAETSQNNA